MSANTPQPAPRPRRGRPIWDLVVEDMRERDRMGSEKYGMHLRAGDGRNSLMDAYQEALDLVVYLRKAIEERAAALDPPPPDCRICDNSGYIDADGACCFCSCAHGDPHRARLRGGR